MVSNRVRPEEAYLSAARFFILQTAVVGGVWFQAIARMAIVASLGPKEHAFSTAPLRSRLGKHLFRRAQIFFKTLLELRSAGLIPGGFALFLTCEDGDGFSASFGNGFEGDVVGARDGRFHDLAAIGVDFEG